MKNAINKLVDVQFSQLTMVELWFQKLNLKKKKKLYNNNNNKLCCDKYDYEMNYSLLN